MMKMLDKQQKMKDLQKVRRRKIVIQKRTTAFDEWDNEIIDWTDWRTVFAEMNSLYGQDYYAAKVHGEENTIEFTLKHVEFLEEMNSDDYRVKFQGKHYNIETFDPLKDDGQWVKIKCLERDSNA